LVGREGVVLSRTGGRYLVYCEGEVVEASLRGRMKQRDELSVLVGDRVALAGSGEVDKAGDLTIEQILPRHSVLQRRSPGRGRGVRTVAANVDQVVIVGAARDPVWDPYLIDRFTAIAEANQLPSVLVINKVDLDPDAARHGTPYEAAGYPVILTSVLTQVGIDGLWTRLHDTMSLFMGPTGVGKSSLLNALVPGLTLRTAAVSSKSRAGRHTTVSAEMHALGGSGFVVDTPGLRDVGLWGLEPQEVAAAFPEFRDCVGRCRFDNCRHVSEPSCVVRDAVDLGELSRSRYDSYCRLLAEVDDASRPWA